MIALRGLRIRWWYLCLLPLLAAQAQAARVSSVQVTRSGTHFVIGMRISIDAPPPAVFRALQDYAEMARYNPDLRSVRIERTAARDRVRLFTTIHACVLIFCKTMHQEQIMTAAASADGGTLNAVLVPQGGDFKEGHGRWFVGPCRRARTQTCMDVRLELVPGFWVPPVIGPWVLRRKMDEEARRTAAGLEQTARGGGAGQH
ncbi:MAG TPA: SRPBCC family protein [Steroidobacteraceae bacterium]